MIYRTKDGDVLDALCLTHYGARAGATEMVLNANPGLGQLGPFYASGVLITFPDLPPEAHEATTIKLRD